jgi:hypothetical protein
MYGSLISLLSAIRLAKLGGAMKRTFAWLKPSGLAGNKPLFFTIGETAYMASDPCVPKQEAEGIIVQVNLDNPNLLRSKAVMTFRLNASGKPPYPLSGARRSERGGGWYLVPPAEGTVQPLGKSICGCR